MYSPYPRLLLSRYKAAPRLGTAVAGASSFNVLLSTFSLFLSPFSQLSIRSPTPLPFAVPPHSHSPLLLRSPLFPQSVELNLNDTLTGKKRKKKKKKSLSDLILLVSPFQRAGDMAGEFQWSVRDRDGRESSLVEYLKTTHPSYAFPKGALAYLRSIISTNISLWLKICMKRLGLFILLNNTFALMHFVYYKCLFCSNVVYYHVFGDDLRTSL